MTAAIFSGRPQGPISLDNFQVYLRDTPFSFWMMLGQAKSNVQYIDHVPLLPEMATRLNQLYLVKGVHSTTAIEGNTLTEDEVMAIYRKASTLPPSRLYQYTEVNNVLEYMNERNATPLRGKLTEEEVCEMNERVLRDLETESHVSPGTYRKTRVTVGGYICPEPEEVSRYMRSFVKWYNEFPSSLGELDELSFSIVKAITTHMYFVLIHPFGDGNGRTARLLEWRTLDEAKIPQPATHLLSNHYNLTRSRYYEMLDRASRGGDMTAFLCYALEGLRDGLASQLEFITKDYADLVYGNIVREKTPGVSGDVRKRRRELALQVRRIGPATKAEIMTASPVLAMSYAKVTEKTLARDLTALAEVDLVRRVGTRWVGRADQMHWAHKR